MRALVLAPFSPKALEDLRSCLSVCYESWTETRKLYDPEELGRRIDADDIAILVVEADFLFEELFQEARPLRFVGICRNSLHHVDLDAATEHGVVVVNTPARNAQGVAEHTLGLMLSLARRIPQAHRYVVEGGWQEPTEPYVSMKGIELEGKTVGIVGLGAVGRRVARMTKALGMRVLGFDPYVKTSPTRVERVGLDDLMGRSDFVTIHASATEETEGLINGERLALMKPGAYLVNTADASLVEQGALVRMLEEGHIAGVAIDVFESHPLPSNSPLLRLRNVILTPHIAGATDGTLERQSWMIVEDVRRFLEGRRPKNFANPQVWRSRGR